MEEAIALNAAIDYLNRLGMDRVATIEANLTQYAMQKMKEIRGIEIFGPEASSSRGGILAFNLPKIHPHDLATFLDQRGIAARAGHHCAQPLHQKLGVPATTRFSFYIYNMFDEVDKCILALQGVLKFPVRIKCALLAWNILQKALQAYRAKKPCTN